MSWSLGDKNLRFESNSQSSGYVIEKSERTAGKSEYATEKSEHAAGKSEHATGKSEHAPRKSKYAARISEWAIGKSETVIENCEAVSLSICKQTLKTPKFKNYVIFLRVFLSWK